MKSWPKAIGAAAALALASSSIHAAQSNAWVKYPSQSDVSAVFPPAAAAAHVNGQATMECTITPQGLLTDCIVTAENPKGYNFAATALSLAPLYQAPPAPMARKVTIPMSFTTGVAGYAEQMKAQLRAQGVDVEQLIRDLQVNDNTRITQLRAQGIDPDAMRAALGMAPDRAQSTQRLWSAPVWVAAPTWAQLSAAFPRMATATSGTATIQCQVQTDGSLKGCEILNETPRNNGIGSAAIKLSEQFKARVPEAAPGRPTTGLVVQLVVPLNKAPNTGAPRTITQPNWLTVPSAGAVASAFPATARERNVTGGTGRMSCAIAADGKLTDCTRGPELPAGSGFSDAALRLAGLYTISPWVQGVGPSEGARIPVTVQFGAPQGALGA